MTSQADGPDQELLRARAHVLALRAEPWSRRSRWIDQKFGARPVVAEANKRALKAGYAFGETTEMFHTHYRVKPAKLAARHVPQHHRQRGDRARLPGRLASSPTASCSTARTRSPRPATSSTSCPATRAFGVKTFQAEDEIAAIGAAIGASYGGALALTASSGPGIALKTEAMGLAVMVELPLVVIDVQRAGPSTGHADQERAGRPAPGHVRAQLATRRSRSSRRPRPASASTSPSRRAGIALKYMTPVVYLSDAFLATGSEPWKIPALADLPGIGVANATDPATFRPYQRDPDTLARPWAVPGTPGLEHRIGGLEKADITGNVSYDPDNHHRMQLLRAAEGRRHRRRHPAARGLRARAGRAADPRLGLDLRRHPLRGRAPARRRPVGRPRAPAPPQPVPGQHRGRSSAATGAC